MKKCISLLLTVLLTLTAFACAKNDNTTPENTDPIKEIEQFQNDTNLALVQENYKFVKKESSETSTQNAIKFTSANKNASDTEIIGKLMTLKDIMPETILSVKDYSFRYRYYKGAFPNYYLIPLMGATLVGENYGDTAPLFKKNICINQGESNSASMQITSLSEKAYAFTTYNPNDEFSCKLETNITAESYTIEKAEINFKYRGDSNNVLIHFISILKDVYYYSIGFEINLEELTSVNTSDISKVNNIYLECLKLGESTGVVLNNSNSSVLNDATKSLVLEFVNKLKKDYTRQWHESNATALSKPDYNFTGDQYDAIEESFTIENIL